MDSNLQETVISLQNLTDQGLHLKGGGAEAHISSLQWFTKAACLISNQF